MKRLRYILINLWDLITKGRLRTPKEHLIDLAKKKGYTSVHKVPKRYTGKTRYRKAPSITR